MVDTVSSTPVLHLQAGAPTPQLLAVPAANSLPLPPSHDSRLSQLPLAYGNRLPGDFNLWQLSPPPTRQRVDSALFLQGGSTPGAIQAEARPQLRLHPGLAPPLSCAASLSPIMSPKGDMGRE